MYSLTSAVIKYLHQKPMIVSNDMQMDIKLDTEAPRSIGADRIVNTTYAWNTFHRSCIIVDFGTATTYDYIDQNGVFRYVVIQPGLGISLNALTSMTAKLPEIEIVKPKSVLGTNTIEGMQAGVVYGYIGSVEYIIKTMKKELNDSSCMVIATGGLGKIIANETDEIDAYDADIAYKGMKILYLILNQYQDIYSRGLVYSLLSLFISCIITRAIFLANNGGTAFPTCFIWDILLPINLKVSGKDCNLAASLTVIALFKNG